MSQERTEAVVLRGVDFSETSRIVTLLTPDRGRLACIAKGARRKKSPLAAALDTFNRLEIVYYWRDGRAVQILGETALLDGYGAIKADLEKATFAAFPLELALKIAHENEPSHALYAVLVRGLDGLAPWPGSVRTYACWLALQLLSAAGFEPALDACAECGKAVGNAPGFSYQGGVVCPQCVSDRRLTAEQHEALRVLVRSREACPRIDGEADLYRLVHRYAARQLETDLRSVRVIDQMFDERD